MFKDYNQNQIQLLPQSLEESIKPDHMARLIDKVIDEMDIRSIENTYYAMGQHPYHPKMLLKVLVYGYSSGIRSSRKLADRLREDVAFMWLASRQTPDFRTISDFRKDKLKNVKQIFTEVLSLCQELGMIRVGKVSFDGTKIRADVSGNKIQYRKLLGKRKQTIAQKVEDILNEADAIDKEEEKLYGNQTEHSMGMDMDEVSRRLAKIKRRKETLKRNHAKLKAKDEDIDKKLGQMRKDRNSMSSTDKDATMMLMKEGHIAPGYNVQFATEHQVILGYGVYSDRNDQRLLKPVVQEIQHNTMRKPDIAIADAGYGTKSNYRYVKNEAIAAFIPYNNFNKEMVERNKGVYELPKKIDVELERYKFRQRLRLLSPEGKEFMARRRQDIEPTIGDIKRNMNFRRFHLRGKPKCLIEVGLVSIGHNLKKIKTWVKRLAEADDGRQMGIVLGTVLGYRPA